MSTPTNPTASEKTPPSNPAEAVQSHKNQNPRGLDDVHNIKSKLPVEPTHQQNRVIHQPR